MTTIQMLPLELVQMIMKRLPCCMRKRGMASTCRYMWRAYNICPHKQCQWLDPNMTYLSDILPPPHYKKGPVNSNYSHMDFDNRGHFHFIIRLPGGVYMAWRDWGFYTFEIVHQKRDEEVKYKSHHYADGHVHYDKPRHRRKMASIELLSGL